MGTRQKEVLVAELERSASHGWMKNLHITIHPFSALIGAALVCLTMLTVGAIAVQGSSSTRDVSAIEIVSDPHPRDFVRIDKAQPYTVPAGKLFHLTGLGSYTSQAWVRFYVDGNFRLEADCNTGIPAGNACSIRDAPEGIVVQPGSVLTVGTAGTNEPVALGYLVDA